MKSAVISFVVILTSVVALQAQDWVPLFDGSSLDCFKCKPGGWEVKDGAMVLNKKGGWAWTKEAFGDFVLELEFNVTPKCNSGIFIRTNPKNPVQGGFEIQVLDSHGKKTPGKHDCGALYDAMPPKVNAVKAPGEWNKMVISWQGPKLNVELNGKVVVDVNIDDWDTARKNPDGSKNKFKTALKDLPRTGHIGFQDHGKPVSYRNVRIKKL